MSWRKPKNCRVSFGCRYLSRALFCSERWSPASTLSIVASVAASVTGGSAASAAKAARKAAAERAVRGTRRWVVIRWLLACASGGAVRFEVRIAGEFRLVEAFERLALRHGEAARAHGALAVAGEARGELARGAFH